jgi:hypothetical protein
LGANNAGTPMATFVLASGRLFMSIRVTLADRSGEHWLVLEHATGALSPAAERKFRKYRRFINRWAHS